MTDQLLPDTTAVLPWTPGAIEHVNDYFQDRPAEELVQWSLETFGSDVVLGTGFGPSGVVLVHMVARIRPQATIFYLDTDVLFAKTYALRDQLEAQLGIQFTRLHSDFSLDEQANSYGSRLWARNPDLCCQLRKVIPLRRFLADKRAWMTGIRREQSPTRANTRLVEWNVANQVLKINPLAAWSESQIWDYIRAHKLPFNPLHEQGYPSLGCVPCTRAIAPGEDQRAGRWFGYDKLECGIHVENGQVRRVNVAHQR